MTVTGHVVMVPLESKAGYQVIAFHWSLYALYCSIDHRKKSKLVGEAYYYHSICRSIWTKGGGVLARSSSESR